jgi:hypothetical protein
MAYINKEHALDIVETAKVLASACERWSGDGSRRRAVSGSSPTTLAQRSGQIDEHRAALAVQNRALEVKQAGLA